MADHILLLAQIDDCSGEVLGEALEQLAAIGVRNVQLLSSLTKKGRPGNVLLLDLDRDLEPQVALFLAAELGVWGYHVLQTSHQHFETSLEERQVHVISGDSSRTFTVRCKLFRRKEELLRVKLEHADAVEVVSFVRSLGRHCSLADIRGRIEQEVWSQPLLRELELRI
ncbi:MAG: nickel insertion protein [bacterium]